MPDKKKKTGKRSAKRMINTDRLARFKRFADGIEQGRNYFVSAEELQVTQTQRESPFELLFESVDTVSQGPLALLTFSDISDLARYINKYSVESWKQYTIYSDDYGAGINFLIWYVKLGSDNENIELLIDAEDRTVYGIYQNEKHYELVSSRSYADNWESSRAEGPMSFINFTFGGIGAEELCDILRYLYLVPSDMTADVYDSTGRDSFYVYDYVNGMSGGNDSQSESENYDSVYSDFVEYSDAERLRIRLNYSGSPLSLTLHFMDSDEHAGGTLVKNKVAYYIYYPEYYMGIDEICELIPEFLDKI